MREAVVGDRIELDFMLNDPAPIETGARGTIRRIQALDWAKCIQIDVEWDNGRTLFLCCPPDKYHIIQREVKW